MKNIYRIACLLCLFVCCKNTFAGNILGAELTYKQVAGDSFDIFLKVYRDCNGSTTLSPSIRISNTCTTYHKSLLLVSSRDVTGIPQNCPQQSKCNSGTFPYGIEEKIFNARIRLDSGVCCNYTMCWENERFSNDITTGPADDSFFVCTQFNRCQAYVNAQPEFNFPPKFFIQYKKDAFINLSAVDSDRDSLSYELIDYNNWFAGPFPWDYDMPFSFLGYPLKYLSPPAGMRLDSASGIFNFRPTVKNQVGVYAVRVNEWRKIGGVSTVIGSVTRLSVGYIISDSTSNAPKFSSYTTLAGGNGNPNYAQENICNNSTQTYCNEFKFTDADTTDTLYFNYRHNLTNITFTNIGTATKPVIKVCYTPTLAELNSGKPLNFKIEVNDGKCPLPGTSEMIFTYKALAPLPDSFAISKNLTCRDINLKTINNSSLSKLLFRMSWDIKNERDSISKYINGDSIIIKLDSGLNKIKLYVQDKNFGGGNQKYCDTRVYEDSIFIDPKLHLEINAGPDTTLCNNAVLPLNPVVVRGTAPFVYRWEDSSTSLARVFHATLKKDTLLITVTDSNNCRAQDTVFVNYYNPVVTLSGDTAKCINNSITLTANLSGTTAPYNYEWIGFTANLATIKPTLLTTTKYDFSLLDGSGCVVQASRTVTAYDPEVIPIHTTAVCAKDSVYFTTNTSGGLAPYMVSWPTFALSGDSVAIKTDTAGNISYTVTVTDAYGCTSQNSGAVTVHELPAITPAYPIQVCAGDSISLSGSISGGQAPYTINWSPFGVSGTAIKVAAPVAGMVNFNVSVADSNGCKASQAGYVTVNPLPSVTAVTPRIICQSVNRINLFSFGSPSGGTWMGHNVSRDSLTTSDTGLVNLNYTYTDTTTGCTNNDTTTAYVEFQPIAGFFVDSVKGPISYTFNFTNTSTKAVYNTVYWDFGDPASGPANYAATLNATHTFSDSGTYTVKLILSASVCEPDTEVKVIKVYRISGPNSIQNTGVINAKVYPNPATDALTVEGDDIENIRIVDVQGREMNTEVLKITGNQCMVNVKSLSAGLYFVEITDIYHRVSQVKIAVK